MVSPTRSSISHTDEQYLLAIFQQITRSSEEIEEIRTLLSSDFPFSVETLQTVYATLSKIVSAGKEQHASQLKEQFHTIHQKLEQESADA